MVVPKLIATNFEDFNLALFGAARRQQVEITDTTLDYLLRGNDVRNFSANWSSREVKLNMCISFRGEKFSEDSEALYSIILYYWHRIKYYHYKTQNEKKWSKLLRKFEEAFYD